MRRNKYQLSLTDPRDGSCCRQSLTITAINYSGRASELGGTVNLVDRRRPSLSRSDRPPFSSYVDSTFDDRYAVAKFSKSRISSNLEVPEFPYNTV